MFDQTQTFDDDMFRLGVSRIIHARKTHLMCQRV